MRDLNTLNRFRQRDLEMKLFGIIGGATEGVFIIPRGNVELRCIAANGGGWDHVSISVHGRIPTWAEMCFIKEQFFEDDEVAMQLHPAKKNYINFHPNTLHLWRPHADVIPLPPLDYV